MMSTSLTDPLTVITILVQFLRFDQVALTALQILSCRGLVVMVEKIIDAKAVVDAMSSVSASVSFRIVRVDGEC